MGQDYMWQGRFSPTVAGLVDPNLRLRDELPTAVRMMTLTAALSLLAVLAACATAGPVPTAPALTETAPDDANGTPTAGASVLAPLTTAEPHQAIPALATRWARLDAAGRASPPILLLDEPLDDDQLQAQALAVGDPVVVADLREPATGAPLRIEVLGVNPVRASDLTDALAVCRTAACFRVELYNHALTRATIVVVDVTNQQVLTVDHYPGLQPDLPPHLVRLAEDIAIHSPEVAEVLGFTPERDEAMMSGTKTALNQTRCERSLHLCVAPTFLHGDGALWAIVDLTDGRLVGIRWTSVGKSGTGPVVTEKRLQDEAVTARYCERETALERDGWALSYILASSDGLRVSDVRFQGRPVLDDAKLVDWHVSYSGEDAFGYSDAIGCPTFSQAAVVAHAGPEVTDLAPDGRAEGFSITQDFMSDLWPAPCNYRYRQRFEFYRDGRFRVVAGNAGRGCGDDGTYRPVLRLGLAASLDQFASRDGGGWRTWDEEGYELHGAEAPTTPEGYAYRITDDGGGGFYVEPGRGQFGDGGRVDNAYTYVTADKPGVDEGRSDLITIGPCCNEDHRQGPERFMLPEPDRLDGRKLVLWYVPQMENDDRPGQEYCWADTVVQDGVYSPVAYPCYAGPMFVPIGP